MDMDFRAYLCSTWGDYQQAAYYMALAHMLAKSQKAAQTENRPRFGCMHNRNPPSQPARSRAPLRLVDS